MKKIFFTVCSSIILFTACNTGTKNNTPDSDSAANVSTSGGSAEESKEERNKQVAMDAIKAVISNNPDEAFKNMASDAVDYNDGSAPPTKGLDSIKAGMKMWMNNIQDYRGDSLEALADGNKVMVYGDWSGKFKGDFMGMKTAGKSFKVKDVDIFTFNDEGKIKDHRSVQSMAALMASRK
jgi:predicted ester cyclase